MLNTHKLSTETLAALVMAETVDAGGFGVLPASNAPSMVDADGETHTDGWWWQVADQPWYWAPDRRTLWEDMYDFIHD